MEGLVQKGDEMSREFFRSNFFLALSILFFSTVLGGCAVQDSTATNTVGTGSGSSPTPTPTPTPGDGTSRIDSSVTEFKVTVKTDPNYTSAISKWTNASLVGGVDGTTSCTATAGQDLLCVVDMNELDLYFRGYTLIDTEPNTLCAYRRFMPYVYAVAPFGVEPSAVTYTLDANSGIVANSTGQGGTNADIYYRINGTWRTHTQLYGVAATKDTDVQCTFNYSAGSRSITNGKNCCYGPYSRIVKNSTGVIATSAGDWGGKRGNCMEGPGMDYKGGLFFTDGLPDLVITNIDSSVTGGLSTSLTIPGPITLTSKGQRQIYGVNYYKLASHGSDVPASTRFVRSYLDPRDIDSTAYFTYDCLDAAEDVVARIRVLVRRWSTKSEFAKFIDSKGLSGDPDLAGLETTPTHSDPNPTTGLGRNIDRCNWDDWASSGYCQTSFGNLPLYSSGYFGFASTLTPTQLGIFQDDGTFRYLGFPVSD